MLAPPPPSRALSSICPMAERGAPAIYSIPPHRAFADAFVAGVLAQFGKDRLSLARGTILVPNNRASVAITAAFVRQAENGLLLPRFVAIGDADVDDAVGRALEVAPGDALPPAIDPLKRQLIMARLVQDASATRGNPITAHEAMRLAAELTKTLDQLIFEEKDPRDLKKIEDESLANHWQASLDILTLIMDRWPLELERLGCIDVADRRNQLLNRAALKWAKSPPKGFVIAAGISTAAPAVARLLRTVAGLAEGQIVLAGLDLLMPSEEWERIGGDETVPPIESHPQFHLHLLLGRIGIARGEVRAWRWGSDVDARAARSRAISNAMAPAEFTGKWETLGSKDRSLAGVHALELATPYDEAQAIAIALRERIQIAGETAALVTPDRLLANRVSAHLERWGISANDSAGQPLSNSPVGTLILVLAEAVAARFAPVPLFAFLKHMLVKQGDDRQSWLDGARALDLALRGPRPAEGLAGISAFLKKGDQRSRIARDAAMPWWNDVALHLAPLETQAQSLGEALAALREALSALAGDQMWQGSAGRAASALFESLEREAEHGPQIFATASLAPLLRGLMGSSAIHDVSGGHPRISIWGLIEAKLQSANLLILGGLNEGVWPALPAPDPWLAPRIRQELQLPSLERRIGLSAHDLAGALGAPDVLITRAKRDISAPTIASRFWLRIEAMTGGLSPPATDYGALAKMIDQPAGEPQFSKQPAPCPLASDRPRRVSVTEVDTLKADPYAFYAQKMLRLSALDGVDAEPGPAWRGSLIHTVLHQWATEYDYQQDKLIPLLQATFADEAVHPLLRALWLPRLEQASAWIAAQVAENIAEGRVPLVTELKGEIQLGEIKLHGRVDRIDRIGGTGLGIIDYKTGNPPSKKQVADGYASQLGLLGLIADRGGFEGISGTSEAFEYWALSRHKKDRSFGWMDTPAGAGKSQIPPDEFVAMIEAKFAKISQKYLTGDDPFTAKLHPEYTYDTYDHLMRLDEWYGR